MRIGEVRMLTPESFDQESVRLFVRILSEKERARCGRPLQDEVRLVSLSNIWYVCQLQTIATTLKIPMERRNWRTDRTVKARSWEVTGRTTWIGEAVAAAGADGVTLSAPITPHTFRHSYAMHILYVSIPLKVLQNLIGT